MSRAIKERVMAIVRSLEGVADVKDGTVRDFNLYPSFAVFTREGAHTKTASDLKTTLRNYDLWAFIQPLEEGLETAAEQAVDTWIETLVNTFDARPGLWLATHQDALATVQNAMIIDDTGFTALEIAGASIAGFVCTLQVEIITALEQGY